MAPEDELPEAFKPDPEIESAVERVTTHIAQNYVPADSFQTAELRLTTAQIMDRLNDHFPGIVSSTTLHVIMNRLRFKQDSINLEFFWLINPK